MKVDYTNLSFNSEYGVWENIYSQKEKLPNPDQILDKEEKKYFSNENYDEENLGPLDRPKLDLYA